MKAIKCFWYNIPNLGDQLNPLLLEHFKIKPILASPTRAELTFIGSILELVPQEYTGLILGSGFIRKPSKEKKFKKARVLAVRGKHSLSCMADKNAVLGDPGLLAPLLINNKISKNHRIGIIAHYIDKISPVLRKFFLNHPDQIVLIDIQGDPKNIIYKIASCEYIISSSLHGLVVADSFRIPNRWIKLSENIVGNDFKFMDYYSTFDLVRKPLYLKGNESIQDITGNCFLPPPILGSIQNNLYNCLLKLKDETF